MVMCVVSFCLIVMLLEGEGATKGRVPQGDMVQSGDFHLAKQRVKTALLDINEGKEGAFEQLSQVISKLDRFGESLARDREARELLRDARVLYARALLNRDQRVLATQVMDDIIRGALGAPLVEMKRRYGLEIASLYDERVAALESLGTGTIEIECHVSCEIVVEHTPIVDEPKKLYLGVYRVWIREQVLETPVELGTPPLQREIELVVDAQTEHITFGVPSPGLALSPSPPPPEREDVDRFILRIDRNARWLRGGGIGVTSLGSAALLSYGVAHITRWTTGRVLSTGAANLHPRDEERLIRAYNTGGIVAFNCALAAGVLIPTGIGMLVGGRLLERKRRNIEQSVAFGPGSLILRF